VPAFGRNGPLPDVLGETENPAARRRQSDSLVIELRRNDPPTVVLLPDSIRLRNPQVRVVGGCRGADAVLGDRRKLYDVESGAIGGNDKDRQALVLGCGRVCTRG